MKNFNDYLRIIQEQTENISKEQIAKNLYAKVKSAGRIKWHSEIRSDVFEDDKKIEYGLKNLSEDEILEVLDMVDEMFS